MKRDGTLENANEQAATATALHDREVGYPSASRNETVTGDIDYVVKRKRNRRRGVRCLRAIGLRVQHSVSGFQCNRRRNFGSGTSTRLAANDLGRYIESGSKSSELGQVFAEDKRYHHKSAAWPEKEATAVEAEDWEGWRGRQTAKTGVCDEQCQR